MNFSRRDFLKAAGLFSLGLSLPATFLFQSGSGRQTAVTGPNILVLVFDAFSAHHLSLYGYPRKTTPNIDRLAEQATVYHRHISCGNYTITGTATLLSGQIPWNHRAFQHRAVADLPDFPQKNIFRLLPEYNRLAYTHNPLASVILNRYFDDIDALTPIFKLYLNHDYLVNTLFRKDLDAASVSWLRTMKPQGSDGNYSLFLSRMYQAYIENWAKKYRGDFPRGLPNYNEDNYFLLEDATDWVGETLLSASQPFLAYIHLFPPHSPYHTPRRYIDAFLNDGFRPMRKPRHFLDGVYPDRELLADRRLYDEFILYLDDEVGRLFGELEKLGVLENTWVILTSDHGEMFERGVLQHSTPLLYQPVIQVPLLIFAPGQTARQDIYEYTSSADLLPTILHLAGKSGRLPGWADGQVLPPFAARASGDVFAVQSGVGVPQHTMWNASTTIIREPYKLIYYFGYPDLKDRGEMVELYNLAVDPQEMNDIYASEPDIGAELLAELKERIEAADRPYTRPDQTALARPIAARGKAL